MNKAVMISIQPKWVEKIANGTKTIEVRKTKPTLATPFKCYIYETIYDWCKHRRGAIGCGKVVGEFVVSNIKIRAIPLFELQENLTKTCLSARELEEYAQDRPLFFWQISDLKIYDKPKDLREFKTLPCEKSEKHCENCKFKYRTSYEYGEYECEDGGHFLTRPFQSWGYVEVLQENTKEKRS